jgi:branched-chain amino acid transport system ATP-binding protein
MSDPILSLNKATVTFGGVRALDDLSFDVNRQEIVGVIGPNGAGKTTLFNSLVGLQKLRSGTITLDGVVVSDRKPHQIAALGMTKTFQNTSLFPDMDVLGNVTTAALLHHPLGEASDKAAEILDRMRLTPIARAGIDALTFPQRALIEMARAMATNPRVLLLDEVMAALTPSEMDEVMETARQLRADGLTILVVEHHMRAIMSLCDRIVVVSFGRKIAEGTPDQIAADPAVIEAYLGSSAKEQEVQHA